LDDHLFDRLFIGADLLADQDRGLSFELVVLFRLVQVTLYFFVIRQHSHLLLEYGAVGLYLLHSLGADVPGKLFNLLPWV